jgi:signal transduction histidine kinase
MVNQDKLKAVVYLENNLITHAFPPERVAVLTAIATPAAVTLENVFMYSHLDELVKQRTAELRAAQAKLAENAHKAGMSEIATSVLHNVGNVLNSLKTAGYVARETAKGSVVSKLLKANELLGAQMDNIDEFIASDPKGKKLLRYYLELGEMLNKENTYIVENLTQILDNTDSISEIISAQQAYAYSSNSFSEIMPITEIIENALTLSESSHSRHHILVEKRFGTVPKIPIQKTKTLHVILNLLKNAKEAMTTNRLEDRKLVIDVHVEEPHLILAISDTGYGIVEENLSKIFSFGFTTKSDGHGSGLHSSANYMTEMGGRMWAESAGEGKGATFTLAFPLA